MKVICSVCGSPLVIVYMQAVSFIAIVEPCKKCEEKEIDDKKNPHYGTSGLPVIYKTPKGSIPPILRLDEEK